MKNQNVGRLELLQWINEFTECDYPKLELCCDAVGYCQVLDAIHPGIINLQKLNFSAKYTDDYSRNLKLLDEACNKLEIEKVVPIDKLAKGKFQDNMRFLQWLFSYASRTGPVSLKNYKGYERRLDAMSKQKNKEGMNAHLVPNKAFLKFKPKKFSQIGGDIEQNDEGNIGQIEEKEVKMVVDEKLVDENSSKLAKKLFQVEDYLKDLEGDLKMKMEYNWKLMYAIEDMLYQRTTLYNILTQIEGFTQKNQVSEFKETVTNIITYTPNDFKQEEDLK